MKICGILIPSYDRVLSSADKCGGCLKSFAHDQHLNKLSTGEFIIWEDISPHDDEGRPIEEKEEFVYSEITKEEALKILRESYEGNIPEKIMKIIDQND